VKNAGSRDARVAELADALDLGSSEASHGGSNPPSRTISGEVKAMPDEQSGYLKDVRSPSTLKRVLEFEVPRERVENEIEKIIRDIRKEVSLPGFRKGKASLDLIRARFAETAQKEALERLIPEVYQGALERESLRPVLPAEISELEYGKEGPLSFQAVIELFPEIDLRDYKGIKARKQVKSVDESDVNREIEVLRERLAKFEKSDRDSETGDVVILDYWRLGEDGEPVKGSRVSNYPVEIGAGKLLRELDQGLIGVKEGDEKIIDVIYPDDFPEEGLRGKTARFGIKVKRVGRLVLPEIDDKFAETLGQDSMESVRTKMRERLAAAYEEESVAEMKREILKQVVDSNPMDVPEGLVERGLESMMESYREENALPQTVDVEEKLKEIRERLRPVAVNIVKEHFVIDEIARKESIVVEESEIEEILKSIADHTGISVEKARRRAAESEEIARWHRDILRNKVLDFLLHSSDIEE
jgi:trigger factor